MQAAGRFKTFPVSRFLASISIGIFEGRPLLDLKYDEDVKAEVDMNVVMNASGELIEVQGTAEGVTFTLEQLNTLVKLASEGLKEVFETQRQALSDCEYLRQHASWL